jgi:hypothetical protein
MYFSRSWGKLAHENQSEIQPSEVTNNLEICCETFCKKADMKGFITN